MSILTVLAGNYLGDVAGRASKLFLGGTKDGLASLNFDKILHGIEGQKLTLNDLQLSREEKAEILDLVSIAKQGDIENFEIEIHGQLYSLDTNSLELTPTLN